MVLEEACHGSILIRRTLEHVAETTTGKDDLFACTLGLKDRRVRIHLSCADRGDERTNSGEEWVEARAVEGLCTC